MCMSSQQPWKEPDGDHHLTLLREPRLGRGVSAGAKPSYSPRLNEAAARRYRIREGVTVRKTGVQCADHRFHVSTTVLDKQDIHATASPASGPAPSRVSSVWRYRARVPPAMRIWLDQSELNGFSMTTRDHDTELESLRMRKPWKWAAAVRLPVKQKQALNAAINCASHIAANAQQFRAIAR